MNIRCGSFQFQVSLIPTLATILLLPLLLGLGIWQLDRARQKEALQAQFAQQLTLPVVALDTLELSQPEAQRYRQISAHGDYDKEQQILLDNQVVQRQPGYYVYTPLRMSNSESAILVNRGWLPVGASRATLPDIDIAETKAFIQGRLSQPTNPGLQLDNTRAEQPWPWPVQHIDYAELSATLGYPLLPMIVLLDPNANDGYRREWQPSFGGMGPERHRGYAVQWFALALTLIVIYGVVNSRRLPPVQHQRS